MAEYTTHSGKPSIMVPLWVVQAFSPPSAVRQVISAITSARQQGTKALHQNLRTFRGFGGKKINHNIAAPELAPRHEQRYRSPSSSARELKIAHNGFTDRVAANNADTVIKVMKIKSSPARMAQSLAKFSRIFIVWYSLHSAQSSPVAQLLVRRHATGYRTISYIFSSCLCYILLG